MITYICKNCNVEKLASEFTIHKKGYRLGKCKPCDLEYQRDYYLKNIEKVREVKRVGMAKMRARDPEKARIYQKQNRDANIEHHRKRNRTYASKRFFWTKAMKLKGLDRANTQQIASLWKFQRGLCALTGEKLDRDAQLDHKLPKARGGLDSIENLQWVTRVANFAKRDLTDAEFLEICKLVVLTVGARL